MIGLESSRNFRQAGKSEKQRKVSQLTQKWTVLYPYTTVRLLLIGNVPFPQFAVHSSSPNSGITMPPSRSPLGQPVTSIARLSSTDKGQLLLMCWLGSPWPPPVPNPRAAVLTSHTYSSSRFQIPYRQYLQGLQVSRFQTLFVSCSHNLQC